MKLMKSKKGVFDQLANFAIGAGVFAIILVVVMLIMGKVADNTTVAADTNASAAMATAQSEVDQFPDWMGIVIIAGIGVLIIGMIRGFGLGRQ